MDIVSIMEAIRNRHISVKFINVTEEWEKKEFFALTEFKQSIAISVTFTYSCCIRLQRDFFVETD